MTRSHRSRDCEIARLRDREIAISRDRGNEMDMALTGIVNEPFHQQSYVPCARASSPVEWNATDVAV